MTELPNFGAAHPPQEPGLPAMAILQVPSPASLAPTEKQKPLGSYAKRL
jgi:hypothetical protein